MGRTTHETWGRQAMDHDPKADPARIPANEIKKKY
jgi:hypothetical protein